MARTNHTNSNANANANVTTTQTPNYADITATIVKAFQLENEPNKMYFVLDTEFDSLNEKGEPIKTTGFGKNIREATKQLREHCKYIQLADVMAGSAMVNPQLLALCMTGAKVTISRTFKAKDEIREHGEGVYSADCIVNKFIKVETHVDPDFLPIVMNLATTPVKKETPKITAETYFGL